jgi:hypothetical protein
MVLTFEKVGIDSLLPQRVGCGASGRTTSDYGNLHECAPSLASQIVLGH